VFAHYFGLAVGPRRCLHGGVPHPEFPPNLFGEGALSASFIPVYAALLARGDRREATRVAGAVAACWR
jgi:putative peptidoglycan lipid II flippase